MPTPSFVQAEKETIIYCLWSTEWIQTSVAGLIIIIIQRRLVRRRNMAWVTIQGRLSTSNKSPLRDAWQFKQICLETVLEGSDGVRWPDVDWQAVPRFWAGDRECPQLPNLTRVLGTMHEVTTSSRVERLSCWLCMERKTRVYLPSAAGPFYQLPRNAMRKR